MPSSNLKMHTPNLVDSNIERLAALFPNCVTEKPKTDEQGKVIRDMNGEVVLERGIDFELLKQELSHSVIDGSQERYRLDWVGKREAIVTANSPIAKTLRPCRAESVDFETTGNLFIEGDNLEALKLLQESYLGKVKMIYIDPPYNTGNDFIYNDDFAADTAEFFERSGQVDADGNRLVANTESNGRFHSDWLSMMYSRLKLSFNLLHDKGVIFISIDDKEVHNLRKICDEIYGAKNFIGCLVIKTATDNNPGQIKTEHESIVCYAKNKGNLDYWNSDSEKAKLIQKQYENLKDKYSENIEEIQKQLRAWIRDNKSELEGVSHYDNVDEKGVFHDGDIANTTFGGYEYTVLHPITGNPCKIPEKGFRYPEETLKKMINQNDVMFGKDETTLIKPKKRLENTQDVLRSVIYEDGRSSTKKFEELMARDIFQNPKSPSILKRIIDFTVEDNDIVLDFFAGSGTTAEAVMDLNLMKQLDLKFIMVQISEDLDESYKTANDKAKKTIKNAIKFLDSIGKTHTIAEISKERIRRAGAKIRQDNTDKDLSQLDTGFRVLKIDTSNMNDIYYRPQDYSQDLLHQLENNIKADRSDEDLLFQFMLDTGVPLSLPIERTQLPSKSGGHTIYQVGGNSLIASLDYIDASMVNDIAALNPLKFITSERAIATDSDKTNIKERFKQLSPHTDVRFI